MVDNKAIGEALTVLANTAPKVSNGEFLDELGIEIPEPVLVEFNASLEDTQRADILLFNTNLKIIHALWSQVNSLQGALALITKTMDLIETRRNIMGLIYGAPQNTNSRTITFTPLP